MDIIESLRKAYYVALFGNLTANGVNVPLFHKMVYKGQNPDVYGVISSVSNSSKDTFSTIDSLFVIQVSLVSKSLTNPDNTVESLAGQFWQTVLPNKWTYGISPVGFSISDIHKVMDTDRPIYIDAGGKTVLERVIQVSHNIYHNQRF